MINKKRSSLRSSAANMSSKIRVENYHGMTELYTFRKVLRKFSMSLDEILAREQNQLDNPNLLSPEEQYELARRASNSIMDIANDSQFRKMSIRHSSTELYSYILRLNQILPLNKLRVDLVRFYDDIIGGMTSKCDGIGGGVGRCVVECLPVPTIPSICSPHTSSVAMGGGNGSGSGGVEGNHTDKSGNFLMCIDQHPPLILSSYIALGLGRLVRSILNASFYNKYGAAKDEEKGVDGNSGSATTGGTKESRILWGVSTFYQGRLIFSHVIPGAKHHLTSKSAYLILDHITRHKLRIAMNSLDGGSGGGPNQAINRFMRKLSNQDENSESPDTATTTRGKGEGGGFLTPPPLSVLSVNEKIDSMNVPDLGKVWMPRLYLPQWHRENNNSSKENGGLQHHQQQRPDEMMPTRVVAYEYQDVFLVFYLEDLKKPKMRRRRGNSTGGASRVPSAENGQISEIVSLLCSLSDHLSKTLVTILKQGKHQHHRHRHQLSSTATMPSPTNNMGVCWGEPGADIVFIDRLQNKLILLSQRHADASGKIGMNRKRLTKNMMGRRGSLATLMNLGLSSSMPQALDCRHLLASHLPLDVMLAFDDMVNNIHCHRVRQEIDGKAASGLDHSSSIDNGEIPQNLVGSSGDSKIIELCTFLPQGWMYAHAHGYRELYILFDTNMYITITDVQKAALRVRDDFFNDTLL
uniref:Uncharacterized protein n=1 Tax=Ditylum brightwellii TaxID=49249 RepID=A0A7S2EI43_9STRA